MAPRVTYMEQIVETLYNLCSENPHYYGRKGASYQYIYRYMLATYGRKDCNRIKRALKKGVEDGYIVQIKLSFKLTDETKKYMKKTRKG